MKSTRARIGRPIKAAAAGTRASLGLKVTPETKQMLERAALASGRTQSQEAEHRIEQSFDREDGIAHAMKLAYGSRTAGLVLLLATAMSSAGLTAVSDEIPQPERLGGNWLDSPYAFDQAVQAASEILRLARPDGEIIVPSADPALGDAEREKIARLFAVMRQNVGLSVAHDFVRTVQGRKESHDWMSWGETIKRLLGPMATRLVENLPKPKSRAAT